MLQRKLSISLLGVYTLLALTFLYFFFFPTFGNPLLSDILIFTSMLLLLSSLVYACRLAKSSKDTAFALVTIIISSVMARSMLCLSINTPLQDAVCYSISTLNILEYGTLEPVLSWWYPLLGTHLHWPIMHLLTATTAQITGIDAMWLFRFAAPLFGGIFSLMVFSLARAVTKNNSVALLAALFASLADVIIFYQSEYHPQGLALLLFVVIVYAWLKLMEKKDWAYWVLLGICSGAFLLLHHFSSLYIGLLVFSFVIANELLYFIYKRRDSSLIARAMANLRRGYVFLICFGGAVLFYHFVVYPTAFEQFMALSTPPSPVTPVTPVTPLPGVTVFGVPLITFLLRLAKWGILFLGIASIVRVLRKPTERELSLILLLGLIMLTGVLGMAGMLGGWMAGIPIDRFIAFYAPLISIFAAMTVHNLLTHTKFSIKRTLLIKGVTILGAGILLTAGFLNGQPLPYYFKSDEIVTYSWAHELIPSANKYQPTGEWIGKFTSPDSKYTVSEYIGWMVPFFYGERPMCNVKRLSSAEDVPEGYLIINPNMPYYRSQGDTRFDKVNNWLSSADRIYNNGVLEVRINENQ